MYHHGHIGVGLALYAPVAYAVLTTGRVTLAVAGFVVMIWLAMLPDLDTRIPGLTHRGPTHTLVFAVAIGLACGASGWLLGTELARFGPLLLAGFGALVGILAVLAHLLADWLTPMGIAPFWPLSSRRYSLGLCYASNAPANYLLLVLGIGVTTVVLWFTGMLG